MSIRRLAAVLLATAGLVAGSATAAFAGDTPSPAPVISSTFGYNHHHHGLRPEAWEVQVSALGLDTPTPLLVNDVEARGPVHFNRARDITVARNLDIFRLLANSVNVRHSPLPFPTVNFASCTVSFVQDGRWSFRGGTGLFANAVSQNGRFHLQAAFSFPLLRDGRCSLGLLRLGQIQGAMGQVSQFTSPDSIASTCHRLRIPVPVAFDVFAQGTGLASVGQLTVTPSPYASPSDDVTP